MFTDRKTSVDLTPGYAAVAGAVAGAAGVRILKKGAANNQQDQDREE